MTLTIATAEEPRKARSLGLDLVDKLTADVRMGRLLAGEKLPSEAEIMKHFGVSRTVVREALSKLQAAQLVETRHGIGTFVLPQNSAPSFQVSPHQLGTLHEVIALLEFRISIETEASALASQRRNAENLAEMQDAMNAFANAIEAGRDAVQADF
ncbi:MAG: HTH-type transcriptional regulator LutR, partial [Pseudomonadota bacterium]